MILWREAARAEIATILALLAEDAGEAATGFDAEAAFDAVTAAPDAHLMVGTRDGIVIATYQLAILTGLSLRATRRAQLESVRVAAGHRSMGVGAILLRDAETRARAAGCTLIQLTSDLRRDGARAFYARHGFAASHVGMKKLLD